MKYEMRSEGFSNCQVFKWALRPVSFYNTVIVSAQIFQHNNNKNNFYKFSVYSLTQTFFRFFGQRPVSAPILKGHHQVL